MENHRHWGVLFLLVALALAGCAAEPETIVETVVETVEVPVETIVEVAPEGTFTAVPRERTLYYQFGSSGGAWDQWGVHNPYAQGFSHQTGDILLWEPLEFYSAFADAQIPWLATGHEYNDDFTELTVTIREGVKWSDGEPFTAEDVAFTINMLLEAEAGIPFAINVQSWIEEATAPDDYTAVIRFQSPQPRFYDDYLTWKYDNGMIMVPEHIFKDVEDISTFTYFDPEKGWPVTTGPYKIVSSTQTQKWIDRRETWWGAETGFMEMPEVERIVALPSISETQNSQLSINNVIDIGQDLPAGVILSIMEQNPKVITHTPDPPYGYLASWAVNMGFNIQEPPFDNPDIRWAISYAIDRDAVVEFGWEGSSIKSELFLPHYPGLMPFLTEIEDLFETYPTNEFNLEKSAALMEANGYTKDGDGFWVKDGERIAFDLVTWPVLNPPGPVIAELLRQGGFDVTHSSPADTTEIIGTGRVNSAFLCGHWGSVGNDPLLSMEAYNGAKLVETGTWADFYSGLWRYSNPEYDTYLARIGNLAPGDPEIKTLWREAMEIWLKDLPSIPMFQWIHRWPMNTTYWEGWPTEADPYVNGSPAHKTFVLMIHNLEATQPDPR